MAAQYPLGYKFLPNDLELVGFYLAREITGHSLPPNLNFLHVHVYDDSPDHLFQKYKLSEEKEWYFFSSRTKRYPRGNRPLRTAGKGFWKVTGILTIVEDKNGIPVGTKRSLVYHKGTITCNVKTTWSMVEYEINSNGPKKIYTKDMLLDKCVLCKIHHRKCSTKNTESDQQELAIANPSPSLCDEPNSLLPLPQSVPVQLKHMRENNQGRVYHGMMLDESMQFPQVTPSIFEGKFIPQSDPQPSYNVQTDPMIDLDTFTVKQFLQENANTCREEWFMHSDPHSSNVIDINNMDMKDEFQASTSQSTETNNLWQDVDNIYEALLPLNYYDPFDLNFSQADGGFTLKTPFN